jgi:predicted porin
MRAEYALGEVAGDTDKGAAKAVGFSYTGHSVLAAGAYTYKQTATGFANRAFVAGGGVKIRELTAKLSMSRERQDAAVGIYQNTTRFGGVSWQAGAVNITGAVYRSTYDSTAGAGTRELRMLGTSYALSKRSNLYAEVDINRYGGALVPASKQVRQRGVSVGLNHLF